MNTTKHILSNLNEELKQAECSNCNKLVTYYYFGLKNGKPRYRCSNSVLNAQRKLRNTKNPINDYQTRFVYLIKAESSLIKIGVASDINKRITKLQYGSPLNLIVLYALQIPHAYSTESYLHRKFSHLRSHGEWFNLNTTNIKEAVEFISTAS